MTNELQVFKFESNNVRVLDQGGEPWFVAKDVCDVLGLTNPTVSIEALDEDERSKFLLGRQGEANVINESGLYALIMRSNKPEARKFRKWVTSEVLPAIRKQGMYATPNKAEELLDNPDLFIKLLQQFKAERAQRLSLEAQAERDRPKVLFADAVSASGTSILVGELAKLLRQNGIEMGERRMFDWLRRNGWIMRTDKKQNKPTQRAMERGYFELTERVITKPDGTSKPVWTVRVTDKGQLYFMNQFLGGTLEMKFE